MSDILNKGIFEGIEGNNVPNASHSQCASHRKKLTGRQIRFNAIGSPDNNTLVTFLQCETKRNSRTADYHPVPESAVTCKDLVAVYRRCHGSVMGTGKYPDTGRRHCGEELKELYTCVQNSRKSENT